MRTGSFANSMAWASLGHGDKIALLIPGGPGNTAPGVGLTGGLILKPFQKLIDAGYRVVCVTRRRNMPQDHSVADMADDYADLIATEFNGQVDLIIGVSYGGTIAQYLAANHDDRFRRIVVVVAACDIEPVGKKIDYAFAQAMSEGRYAKAGIEISKGLFPDPRFPYMARFLGALLGLVSSAGRHEHFAKDVMVEAEAESAFNSRGALPGIRVPVLLIGGDEDYYFPESLMRETADLIPECHLKLYAGKGHVEVGNDPRLCRDILEFVQESS